MKNIPPQQLHAPVLLDDVVKILAPKRGETYLDLTAGYGGHATAIIDRIGRPDLATLIDQDDNAIAALAPFAAAGARVIHSDFLAAAQRLTTDGRAFDMILLDIGVSSPQLDEAARGFSFRQDAPLDMRMDRSKNLTAADIVGQASQAELTRIIAKYGEESPSRAAKIARAICANRPINGTLELAELIKKTSPRKSKIHPATRTFQALRIAVNDELGQLEQTLPLLPGLLNPGGRLAIISFHSLEDRRVKQFLREQTKSGYEAELTELTKKPIRGDTNDVSNPRARSAKLRAAAKINK